MPWSSNATYLVTACLDGHIEKGVYKPTRGERPLWDFPSGLHRREIAAFELSHALAWDIVPPTILRDGPFGEGSIQLFIDADFEQHHFTLVEHDQHHADLMKICAFDLVANNCDRKSGHCLLGKDSRIYAIDNGLCFAAQPKLRTVIWEFADEPVPPEIVRELRKLGNSSLDFLVSWIDPDELEAVRRRSAALARSGVFPHDPTGRHYPWPLV